MLTEPAKEDGSDDDDLNEKESGEQNVRPKLS
jgi:hypothetical protein